MDEASRQMEAMAEAGNQEVRFAESLGDVFSGLFIEHDPQFVVVILSTDTTRAADVSDIARDSELGDEWVLRVVRYPLRQLQDDAFRAANMLLGIGDVWVNVRENLVEARILQGASIPSGLPKTVRTSETTVLGGPSVDIYGGLGLSNGCTSGFAVQQQGTTVTGILTAGHCGNTTSYAGVNLPFQAGLYSGSHDEQWHTIPGLTPRNRVATNPIGGWTAITSRAYASAQAIGSWVCKYGTATMFGCGTLDNKGFCAAWVPNFNCTYHMVSNDDLDLSSPGDSGGPVFRLNSAWGLTSGSTGNIHTLCQCNLVYTPLNYVEPGMGVWVLTQ